MEPEVLMAEAGGVRVRAMGLAVPETLMTWGEAEALSVRVTVSERGPEAVPTGAKVMEMEQVALAASEAPEQVFMLVKSVGLVPAKATEEMVSMPVPELVTVTMVGPLVVPWVMAGKVTGLVEIMMAGVRVVVVDELLQPAERSRRASTPRVSERIPKKRFLDT